MFLSAAAAKTEHYEISAYTSMVAMARSLGEKRVADLLQKNLSDEKATLRKAETIGRRLGREGAKEQRSATPSRTSSAARSRTGSGRSTSNTRSRPKSTRRSTSRSSSRSRARSSR
jgi:rubrerythrin